MSRFLLLLFVTLVKSEHFNTTCDGFQASFNLSEVGGLRWLINKTKRAAKEKPNKNIESTIVRSKRTPRASQGIIVRLRYHTENAFDVWSKSVEGVNGCFTQVLSLDVGVNDTQKAKNHDAMMQLHTVQTDDGPYLVQLLWGRLISAGVTQDQLKPVFKFIEKLRGPQRLPKICDNPM
ncbi:Germination protein, Ger(X)C family, partial [Operophtera brumata]